MTPTTATLTLTLGRSAVLPLAPQGRQPQDLATRLRALRRHWLPLWARQGTATGQAVRCATASALRALHAAAYYPRRPYAMPVSMVLCADTVAVCRALQGDRSCL